MTLYEGPLPSLSHTHFIAIISSIVMGEPSLELTMTGSLVHCLFCVLHCEILVLAREGRGGGEVYLKCIGILMSNT